MKQLYTAFSICLLFIQAASAQVTQQWAVEYNGTGNNTDLAKKNTGRCQWKQLCNRLLVWCIRTV